MIDVSIEPTIKRMLVVDDEDGPRQSLNMIFSDDFDVTIASSGEEAIELCHQNSFTVVITDIRMRGLSGIDVLREVKKVDAHTEVIVLTAFETLETARQAISLGASEYMKKPFDLDHIQKVVDRCYHNYIFATKQEAVIREDLNAAKTNFLEIVSHELNTPMNGILGFIELLQDTSLDEDQDEFVEMIHGCSLKYFEHVQDILTYAKLTMSDTEVSYGVFNPATMLLKLISEIAPKPGMNVHSEISQSIPQFVSGAEQEIRIIIRKLLQNAVKFTDDGDVILKLSSEPLAGSKVCLTYEVVDSGPGIDSSLIQEEKIFDAFTQGDSSLSRAHEGLGLGLALCRGLSERLSGEISAQSVLGQGSAFTFKVTLDDEEES